MSEETLRNIALELKSLDKKKYDRTFICYYLPDMTVDAGAWATTHFNPNLEIEILGLTADEEKYLTTDSQPSNREVIGSWIDEDRKSRRTIFRENGKLFIQDKFTDGIIGSKRELVESKSSLGRRFNIVKHSDADDPWLIITPNGNLQVRDSMGLIGTNRRIQ